MNQSQVIYKKFEDLTKNDIDLLKQTFRRLMVEGFIVATTDFGDFLDAIVKRGEYIKSVDESWFGDEG